MEAIASERATHPRRARGREHPQLDRIPLEIGATRRRRRETKRTENEETAGMEATIARTLLLRGARFVLVAGLFVSVLPMSGCLESSFNLASDSRLPQWVTLPRGVTRADVSVTLSYYTSLGGDDVKVTLRDKGGRTIESKRQDEMPNFLCKLSGLRGGCGKWDNRSDRAQENGTNILCCRRSRVKEDASCGEGACE